MTEIDNEKLIRDFFAENRREIADNGFSRRVMRNLPERNRWWEHILTVCVTALLVALFVLMGGVEATWATLREVFNGMAQHIVNDLDPKSVIIAAVVLLILGMRKVISMA